jgi:hypothetical protein
MSNGFIPQKAFSDVRPMAASPAPNEEKSVGVMVIDAHEELVQQLESGQAKIRLLSIITVIVAFLLVASYFSQILLPFVSSTDRYQTVDLRSPTLIATEVVLMGLGAAWLYVGIVNYLFATRLNQRIREIRSYENQVMERLKG